MKINPNAKNLTMTEIVNAARQGDFGTAKELFDKAVSSGENPLILIKSVDRRLRSVCHYACEYDESVVVEWLFRLGADMFKKDDSNKSPVDIAVIVDSRLRRKNKGTGEALAFMKREVLNPVQQMFFCECAESTDSVSDVSVLTALTNEQLSQLFPDYNNLQALHLFAMYDRFEEIKYLRSRGIDLKALDDDGNSALHFVSSLRMAEFLVDECGLDMNACNTSDGHTPAHAIIQRAAMDDVEESDAVAVLSFLASRGADFSIQSESEDLGVAELAIDLLGPGAIVNACMKAKNALGGNTVEQYMSELSDIESDDSLSVASHDNMIVREDGEERGGSDEEESESSDDEDFFIRPK